MKQIIFDGHEHIFDMCGHIDTYVFSTSTNMIFSDPFEQTHQWEIDYGSGNFKHSDNCWCMVKKQKLSEAPKDNDGRDICFWCGKKTVQKQLFVSQYDFCEWCQK